MTWLDIIAPIPQTLIPDDERRRGVKRAEHLQIRPKFITFVAIISSR